MCCGSVAKQDKWCALEFAELKGKLLISYAKVFHLVRDSWLELFVAVIGNVIAMH